MRARLVLVSIVFLCGCASGASRPEPPSEPGPEIVASTRVEGRLHPSGGGAGPYLELTEPAASETYGYTPDDPIKVGTGSPDDRPGNERRYLNALLGPEGQVTTYQRVGSCCHFETPNSELGVGLLDVYEVTYEGLAEPVTLYLNMYDQGEPRIPRGFTARR